MSTEGNIFAENKSNPYPFQHKDWNSFMLDCEVFRKQITHGISQSDIVKDQYKVLRELIGTLQLSILRTDLPKASKLLAECQQEFQKTQTDKTVQSIVDKF